MRGILNKTFFHLLAAFVGIVVISLLITAALGYYELEVKGKHQASPLEQQSAVDATQ